MKRNLVCEDKRKDEHKMSRELIGCNWREHKINSITNKIIKHAPKIVVDATASKYKTPLHASNPYFSPHLANPASLAEYLRLLALLAGLLLAGPALICLTLPSTTSYRPSGK
jgi:hypothetical protein